MNTYYNLKIHLEEVAYTSSDILVLSILLNIPTSNAIGLLRRLNTYNVLSVYVPFSNIELASNAGVKNNLKCLHSSLCAQQGVDGIKRFINKLHRLYKDSGISEDRYYVQQGEVFFAIC